jgi:Flp pilus assembly protein TadD
VVKYSILTHAKFPHAAAIFERVRQLSPFNAVAYNNLAGTLYQMGKVDSAIVLWEKAIKLDPSNQQFKTNLEFAKKKR